MKDFCIVGSGIAGSTIANLLAKKYSIEIFDKARGPGGRAARFAAARGRVPGRRSAPLGGDASGAARGPGRAARGAGGVRGG